MPDSTIELGRLSGVGNSLLIGPDFYAHWYAVDFVREPDPSWNLPSNIDPKSEAVRPPPDDTDCQNRNELPERSSRGGLGLLRLFIRDRHGRTIVKIP
jgi:hypothetical protein